MKYGHKKLNNSPYFYVNKVAFLLDLRILFLILCVVRANSVQVEFQSTHLREVRRTKPLNRTKDKREFNAKTTDAVPTEMLLLSMRGMPFMLLM